MFSHSWVYALCILSVVFLGTIAYDNHPSHYCCNVFFFHVAIAILSFFSVVALMLFLHVAEFLYLSYDNCLKYLTYIIL
jgi:hypothetical protein